MENRPSTQHARRLAWWDGHVEYDRIGPSRADAIAGVQCPPRGATATLVCRGVDAWGPDRENADEYGIAIRNHDHVDYRTCRDRTAARVAADSISARPDVDQAIVVARNYDTWETLEVPGE